MKIFIEKNGLKINSSLINNNFVVNLIKDEIFFAHNAAISSLSGERALKIEQILVLVITYV